MIQRIKRRLSKAAAFAQRLEAHLASPFHRASSLFLAPGQPARNGDQVRRSFHYERSLLPNPYLAQLETGKSTLDECRSATGLSMGYPAWSLLYYSLLCSLPPGHPNLVVETGTNVGASTIILAQALKDSGGLGIVKTMDIDPQVIVTAKENVAHAGLQQFVEFNAGDSLRVLSEMVKENQSFQFVFLDGNHEYKHVLEEFRIVHPAVIRGRGKVYFDNTVEGGVREALRYIRTAYGGNLVEFENCSWNPPGNAVWQP